MLHKTKEDLVGKSRRTVQIKLHAFAKKIIGESYTRSVTALKAVLVTNVNAMKIRQRTSIVTCISFEVFLYKNDSYPH